MIFQTDHGLEDPDGAKYRQVKEDIDSIKITQKGIRSKRNYLDSAIWTFNKNGNDGIYNTVVANSDF